MELNIKLLNNNVRKYYETYSEHHTIKTDSGLDLLIAESITVKAKTTHKIPLSVACQPNVVSGYYLYPRSSIIKTPLRLANSVGIIDYTYRGEIMAVVDNISDKDYVIEANTKLFQLCSPDLKPLSFKLVDELTETVRGSGGFGSTG